jgi:outer membrane lipoprotein-sorting protein
MNCMEYRELFAAYLDGLLAERDAFDLEVHISACEECKKELLETRRLTSALSSRGRKVAQAAASLEERVMARVGQEESVADSNRKHSSGIDWRHIMKSNFARFAIAAVFVLGTLTGVYYLINGSGRSGVAWAEVAQLVSGIEDFSFRMTMKGNMNGVATNGEVLSYQSKQYGMRMDTYMGGKVMMTMYKPAGSDEIVTLMPEAKQYMRMKMTPQMAAAYEQKNADPRGFTKWFTSVKSVSLGRSVVDGVEVEGISTDGAEVGMGMFEKAEGKLWVDVKTDLPVRMEISGTLPDGKGSMEMTMSGFDWSNKLDPSLFAATIPDGYKQMGGVVSVGTPGDEAMLKGLRVYAEMFDGKYPKALNMMTLTQDTAKAAATKMGATKSNDMPDGMMQKMMDIQLAAQSYSKLVTEGKSPEYFGETVTAADADHVLLRWKSEAGKVKVVYGDLRVEEIAETNAPAQGQ